MMSLLISFAYFTHFSNLHISEPNADIANGKQRFDSVMEFDVIHLKYQEVKI